MIKFKDQKKDQKMKKKTQLKTLYEVTYKLYTHFDIILVKFYTDWQLVLIVYFILIFVKKSKLIKKELFSTLSSFALQIVLLAFIWWTLKPFPVKEPALFWEEYVTPIVVGGVLLYNKATIQMQTGKVVKNAQKSKSTWIYTIYTVMCWKQTLKMGWENDFFDIFAPDHCWGMSLYFYASYMDKFTWFFIFWRAEKG